MEIKYTYQEPVDRPIERAAFATYCEDGVEIGIDDDGDPYITLNDEIINFNKSDWADFTVLVNRINRQINAKEAQS